MLKCLMPQMVSHGLSLLRDQRQLHIALTSITPPTILEEDDSYCWKVNVTLCNGYSSSQTREAIRPRETTKSWAPIVWYKGACCLCNCSDESREHLFLNCRFSLEIWAQAFARLSPHQPAFFTGT
ncbi:unnamed protein product [Brassica rapa subsp. trilocularis]